MGADEFIIGGSNGICGSVLFKSPTTNGISFVFGFDNDDTKFESISSIDNVTFVFDVDVLVNLCRRCREGGEERIVGADCSCCIKNFFLFLKSLLPDDAAGGVVFLA